jgi:FixJ family two-component response regulator
MSNPSKIAIVDDEPSVLEAIGNLLESAGYSVLRFNAAEQVLHSRELTTVDCLISDIGMPVMTGLALQAEVYRLRPALPVILITGRNDTGPEGANGPNNRGFFRKPFDAQQLLDALATALEGRPGA